MKLYKMQTQKTFILECSRINSVGVVGSGEDFENKSAWTNKTPPIVLKQGDQINLQNVLINIAGADTNSIQFTGTQTTPSSNVQDNFTLMEIGYYMNHNGIYTAALPLVYQNEGGDDFYKLSSVETTTAQDPDSGQTVQNNLLGFFIDYQYFPPSVQVQEAIDDIRKIKSANPNLPINGKKFAKIHPNWVGWGRPQQNGHLGANTEPLLLTEQIPITIDAGFNSPTAIADRITLTMGKTNPLFSSDIFQPTAREYLEFGQPAPPDENPDVFQYNFNGYTYKTITCNLQKVNDSQHRIYGNIAVDDPMRWKHGINIIQNALTDPLTDNPYMNPNIPNYNLLQVVYPVIIWNRFIGNDPSVFSVEFDAGQYSNYSPSKTIIKENAGDDSIIRIRNFSGPYASFNDILRNVYTTTGNGSMLYPTGSDSFKVIRNYQVGTNQHDRALFIDNDDPSHTDIVAWNRYYVISGTFEGTEHEIFRTTDIGQSPGADGYSYSPVGADQYFGFIPDSTRQMLVGIQEDDPILVGDYFVQHLLTDDSGGVVDGGEYTISFLLDAPDWTNISIIVRGLVGGGLPTTTFNSNGTHTLSWTSTVSSTSEDAVRIGFSYNGTSSYALISNISIIQDHIHTDETYTLSSVYTGDTVTPENNKLYSYQRTFGVANVKLNLTNNSLPAQAPYVGVDYNREYILLTKGVIFSSVGNVFSAITTLNNHDANVSLFYNNEDPDYTYWIYQTFSSPTTWYAVRCSKYYGGVPEDGTEIGTIESNIAILKNTNRNGQQMYDFSAGNGWTGTVKNILKNIPNPFDATSTMTFDPAGADIHYTYHSLNSFDFEYIANQTQTWKYVQTILREPVVANETFTISFTISNLTNPGQPIPQPFRIITSYIEGGVNYNPRDFTAEGNHSFTFTTTQGPLNPAIPIYFGFFNTHSVSGQQDRISNFKIERSDDVNITSLVAQNLPTVTSGGTTYEYFASFSAHDQIGTFFPYFLGLVPNPSTDQELLGTAGILLWTEDGGSTYFTGSWIYNTATNTLGCFSDSSFALTASAGPVVLTNIVEYPTSTNQIVSGVTYSVPTDGKQYGNSWDLFGTTSTAVAPTQVYWMGYNNATDPNDVGVITQGFVYDNENDAFANNNGTKWKIEDTADTTKSIIKITDQASGILIHSFSAPKTNIKRDGWNIFRCNKIFSSTLNVTDPPVNITGVTNMAFITDSEEDINHDFKSLSTNGTTGINYNVSTYLDGAGVDTGLFQNFINVDINNTKAYLEKGQLLMTNIILNQDNLEKIKDFFRENEIYNGTFNTRSQIVDDTENYYMELDLGRGDDSSIDMTNRKVSTSQTGKTPYVPLYMWDPGVMGIDNGPNDDENHGCVCPRNGTDTNEERIRVFTRWDENYETRVKTQGMLNYQYTYGDKLTLKEFQTDYTDLYNYCKDNNIGIIPFKAKDGTLRIGFECFQDYINEELFKIQNFTSFIYSPSFVDHGYVTMFNNDSPPISNEADDFAYSYGNEDLIKFINIGATQPSLDYSQDLNRFNFKYFHTPVFFNLETGTDQNVGQEIARIYDNSPRIIIRDFSVADTFGSLDDNRNIGINDSQAGIMFYDAYYQRVASDLISSKTDNRAVLMTKDNFYNSIWFKLGFSYYDLKPLKFKVNSFNSNRFSELTYNNIDTVHRDDGLGIFTTNSLINISNMPVMNIFTVASGTNTANPNKDTPIYGLGYNNNLSTALQVSSAAMFAKSIPVNISSGYYRIYTDLPCNTLEYYGDQSNLACIGYALLNYASSQQFFFSYAMDFTSTITKDILINNIKIEIRDDRGQLIRGLGDRSAVVLKVNRTISLSPPEPDPIVEKLNDIEKDIEEGNAEISSGNTAQELEDIGDSLREPTNEEIQFAENFQIQLVQDILSRVIIQSGDDPKSIARRISIGLASYFKRKDNREAFKKLTDDLLNKGVDAIKNDKQVEKLVGSLRNFYINAEGKALKGTKSIPDNLNISRKGAMLLIDKITDQLSMNKRISTTQLASQLREPIANMILNTNDIEIIGDEDVPFAEVSQREERMEGSKKLIKGARKERAYNEEQTKYISRILDFPFDTFLKIVLKLKEKEIKSLKQQGAYNYVSRLFKQADKDFLNSRFGDFRNTVNLIGSELNDVLGRKEKISDAVRNIVAPEKQAERTATPTVRRRRTKKEVTEAREMGSEDRPVEGGRPTKAKEFRRKAVGAEESPVRKLGRSIIEAKEEGTPKPQGLRRELFKNKIKQIPSTTGGGEKK